MPDIFAHPPRPDPELQHRANAFSTRCARHARNGTRCGSSSTAAPTAPASGCTQMAPTTRACASACCRDNQGKGAAVLHGLRGRARRRLHACADHGFRRPASGRPDPGLHAASQATARERWCSASRSSTPARRCCACAGGSVSNGWTHLETLWAGIGDSLYGFRVYPVAPLIAVMRAPAAGCAASTSTPRRWCAWSGAASSRSTSTRR